MDDELNRMEAAGKRNGAIAHLYGVSLAAAMIAKKRGCEKLPDRIRKSVKPEP